MIEDFHNIKVSDTFIYNLLTSNGIDIISTTNPMAKGRIERLWRTFQDRLYKELKKKNISSLEKANDFITNEFLPRYNNRFALPIDDNKNLFVCPFENFNYNVEFCRVTIDVTPLGYKKSNKSYKILIKQKII